MPLRPAAAPAAPAAWECEPLCRDRERERDLLRDRSLCRLDLCDLDRCDLEDRTEISEAVSSRRPIVSVLCYTDSLRGCVALCGDLDSWVLRLGPRRRELRRDGWAGGEGVVVSWDGMEACAAEVGVSYRIVVDGWLTRRQLPAKTSN